MSCAVQGWQHRGSERWAGAGQRYPNVLDQTPGTPSPPLRPALSSVAGPHELYSRFPRLLEGTAFLASLPRGLTSAGLQEEVGEWEGRRGTPSLAGHRLSVYVLPCRLGAGHGFPEASPHAPPSRVGFP